MNYTGSLFLYLLSYIVLFVKCEFSFSYLTHKTLSFVPCTFTECCNDNYIYSDISKLDDLLNANLFGQHIARHVIVSAIQGHLSQSKPPKALVMSFHGPPGTGKTYVAQMIGRSFYKKGEQSKFFHFFNGRNDFPLQQEVEAYKKELHKTIIDSLTACEKSLFVFDEVDKMPEGLLNVLVPFLDYNTQFKLWRYSDTPINTANAIYIFLSNTGSTAIVQQLLEHWKSGYSRQDAKLQDFEHLISVGAFNEKGGLHHSDTIDTNLIDHYVPFLPLEEEHIKECIVKSITNRGGYPTPDMIKTGLSYVIFGPSPVKIYATSGCKRLEQKVASMLYADGKHSKEEL